ncbi:WD repeat-containing protein 74 [Boothiomyces sp. JEL0838]|nr:WD repeat-containing protein 74 [Boothiomyces sp. JEL0838]
MKFLTGDDNGLVKLTNQKKTLVFGKTNRHQGVQYIAFINDETIAIARSNGQLDIMNTTGTILKSIQLFEKQKFVGLSVYKNIVITCSDHGQVDYTPVDTEGKKPLFDYEMKEKKINLGINDLCCFKVHPNLPHLFATGGKERELSIWDYNSEKTEPVWKAKNVKNNKLDMRVGVWVTDINFIEVKDEKENGNDFQAKILISTGYSHIRIYDPKVQKRPVKEYHFPDLPIYHCIAGESKVYFSDTVGNLTCIDYNNGQMLGKYKGIAGAVGAMALYEDKLIVVGNDRWLRVFETSGKRGELEKVYLKQRLTCVLVYDDPVQEAPKEDETQDIWDEIPTVTEDNKRKHEEEPVVEKKKPKSKTSGKKIKKQG